MVYIKVTGTLHNDGTVQCNGEAGSAGGGGGSGGSILLEVGLIKVSVCVSHALLLLLLLLLLLSPISSSSWFKQSLFTFMTKSLYEH